MNVCIHLTNNDHNKRRKFKQLKSILNNTDKIKNFFILF